MSKSKSTHKELFKALVARIGPAVEEVPDGFLDLQGWMAESGLGREQTSRNLRKGMEAGIVEMRKFRVACGERVYPVPHYKVNV